MSGDLAHLSGRNRAGNLKKLKPLGLWERERLARDEGRTTTPATIRPVAVAPAKIKTITDIKTMSNHGRDEAEPKPQKENETMTNTTRKDGTCGLCDKTGRTKMVDGEFCCATCESLRRNAKKRPQLMLAQVLEFHPELLGLHPPGTGYPQEAETEDRQPLNAELAEANVRLVQKMREMERLIMQQERQIGDLKEQHAAVESKWVSASSHNSQLADDNLTLTRELAEVQKVMDKMRQQAQPSTLAQEVRDLLDPQVLAHEKIMLQEQILILTGELEGLQDVLSSLESERGTMRQERVRLSDQVRWLHEQLAATERKADGYEKEIDRLQEGRSAVRGESLMASMSALLTAPQFDQPAALACDLRNDGASFSKPLIDAYDDQGYRSVLTDVLTDTQLAISDVCDGLRAMLIDKNRAYGNSALEPLRVFSKASPQEQILVRIDDKLSRLSRGVEFPGDDTVMDLAGYLVLLMVQRGQGMEEAA